MAVTAVKDHASQKRRNAITRFLIYFFLIVITGFWLPALLSLMAIYPMLDKSFHVEETVKKMRDEQLENQSNEK